MAAVAPIYTGSQGTGESLKITYLAECLSRLF